MSGKIDRNSEFYKRNHCRNARPDTWRRKILILRALDQPLDLIARAFNMQAKDAGHLLRSRWPACPTAPTCRMLVDVMDVTSNEIAEIANEYEAGLASLESGKKRAIRGDSSQLPLGAGDTALAAMITEIRTRLEEIESMVRAE